MIARILVALDLDRDTPVATRYALARRSDAGVSGLVVTATHGRAPPETPRPFPVPQPAPAPP